MHYASENMFERFWRIKFFDMAGQRLVVPAFQIKATQAAVVHLDVKIAMSSVKIRPKLLLFLIAQLTRFI